MGATPRQHLPGHAVAGQHPVTGPGWLYGDTAALGLTATDIAQQLADLGDDEPHEQADPQPQDDTDQG